MLQKKSKQTDGNLIGKATPRSHPRPVEDFGAAVWVFLGPGASFSEATML